MRSGQGYGASVTFGLYLGSVGTLWSSASVSTEPGWSSSLLRSAHGPSNMPAQTTISSGSTQSHTRRAGEPSPGWSDCRRGSSQAHAAPSPVQKTPHSTD